MMDGLKWNVLASFDDKFGVTNSDIQKDIDKNMYLRNYLLANILYFFYVLGLIQILCND